MSHRFLTISRGGENQLFLGALGRYLFVLSLAAFLGGALLARHVRRVGYEEI
jgi:hypothetical protein